MPPLAIVSVSPAPIIRLLLPVLKRSVLTVEPTGTVKLPVMSAWPLKGSGLGSAAYVA